MPKGQPSATIPLPEDLKFDVINGDGLMAIRKAATIARVHPAILEMGERIVAKPGVEAGVFRLGDDDMRARAKDLRKAFLKGLRRVCKALGQAPAALKSYADEHKLVFWIDAPNGSAPPGSESRARERVKR